MPSASEVTSRVVYQFHVLPLRISQAIWRRILVASDTTVTDLQAILQIIMGWSNSQSFRFLLHGQQYARPQPDSRRDCINADQTLLSDWQLRPQERLLYSYGWLDRWPIQLRLERVLLPECDASHPYCLSGARQGPPEHALGPTGFRDLCWWNTPERADKRLLEIITLCQQQPEQIEQHTAEVRRLCYWLEKDRFDRKTVNRLLQQQAAGTYIWPQADRELSKCRLK